MKGVAFRRKYFKSVILPHICIMSATVLCTVFKIIFLDFPNEMQELNKLFFMNMNTFLFLLFTADSNQIIFFL